MYRALVQLIDGGQAKLSEEELHHLIRVRRARVGDTFVGIDGTGKTYLCTLECHLDRWYGRVLETIEESAPEHLKFTLGQALLKKDKFDWVLQKATELGVFRIVPLITARVELQLSGPREIRRMLRWERIVREAVKQCRRAHIPALEKPVLLPDFLETESFDLILALDEEGDTSLRNQLADRAAIDSCLILVGPEGGWDERDRESFARHQIPRIHLGPRTLRAETAPLAILSILQFQLGDLS